MYFHFQSYFASLSLIWSLKDLTSVDRQLMHFKRLMQLKSPEHKCNWRNERYVNHKQAVRKLTLDASCCIGSLNCDRLVEEDQIAEGLTVGPARYADPW